MSAAPVRRASAELLIETLERRRTLDDALSQTRSFASLQGADRGFARALASAALRQLGRIDAGLDTLLDRPLTETPIETLALLRIGAAQLWLLGTPAHAAVGETVAAAKDWPQTRRTAGLINAVLRRAADGSQIFDATPLLAVWPDWLQRALIDSIGRPAAKRLALQQTEEPPLCLTPKDGDAAALAERVGGEPSPSGSVCLETGRAVAALPGFEEGDWWVQDPSATLPARLLNATASDTVIDLCAAPGGKTLQLAASGAHVVAVDRSSGRLKRLRENLMRTGLGERVDVIAVDAETWRPDQPATHILLDAPCSALGTLRRHPEGAWIKRPEDVARFPIVQARLLRAAIEMLSPGGTLVYCVCSPLRAEGLDVVESALREGAVVRSPIVADECPGFAASIGVTGDVATVSGSDVPSDAFFISRLTKV